MHSGKNFSIKEVLTWTRRDIFALLLIGTVATVCYTLLNWRWLSIPWLPIALLGTAVAFVVGFKNNASYDRTWEARKAWGAIVNASRSWGIFVKDYITDKHAVNPISENDLIETKQRLINRHIAWMTALRYQLREPRVWETINQSHNLEYKNKYFTVEEHDNNLQQLLQKYLSEKEFKEVMNTTNKAAQIISLQSADLQKLLRQGLIEDFRHMEMGKLLTEFYNQQGVSERIKNFPYPRQFATINLYFIKIFVALVPLGMLQEFDKLGDNLVWLTIPFSALSSWVFTTMEKIGSSTESPFEGSANDVPITAISRNIEIDLKEMLHMSDIPTPLKPVNNILL
jgi:putative membrane protein